MSAGNLDQKVYVHDVLFFLFRGNFNRYTKRPLQDSAIICSTPWKGESASYCANHRVSCKCQQSSGWKIHRFFRWKMPFAVFRSGSGVSDFCLHLNPLLDLDGS